MQPIDAPMVQKIIVMGVAFIIILSIKLSSNERQPQPNDEYVVNGLDSVWATFVARNRWVGSLADQYVLCSTKGIARFRVLEKKLGQTQFRILALPRQGYKNACYGEVVLSDRSLRNLVRWSELAEVN